MSASDGPLMLSVSGLRGLVGRTLTPEVASRFAAAFGEWASRRRRPGAQGPCRVVLGRDSRPSGQMVEYAAAAGLVSVGCRVTSLGIVTTPTVGVMVEALGADGGLVITASHNPIAWNGLKALRHDGCAPPASEARELIELFRRGAPAYVGVEALQAVGHEPSANETHIRRVLANIDAPSIRRRKLKVVLDSVHGAGGPATAAMLRELGVEVVHLFGEPTGFFPHTPEPTRENLTGLCDAVRAHGADIGLAQDPDADRLAAVDERGQYIGEEYTLALAARRLLQRSGVRGATLVANLSTSRMIDDVAAEAGARVVRTAVGEANVVEAMRRERVLLGGEGNGGGIWPEVVHVRDSLGGAALLLELLASTDRPLSQVVTGMPAYAIVKDKADVSPQVLEGMAAALRSRFAAQAIDTQDGVRVDWPDRWVHVRASNTEPIIRVIAEAPREPEARALITQVRQAIGLA